jgi:DNA-binding NarL/FixJ family response regulator
MKAPTKQPLKTRILLVDDHALMRRGLASLIETEVDLSICGEATSHTGGLAAIISSKPDLVITDLSLQDSDGMELIKGIKRSFPRLPVLVLSMHEESIYAERALHAGARGYVTKQEIDHTVLIAIRCLLAGEIYTSEAMKRHFTQKFMAGGKIGRGSGLEMLSDRELEIFKSLGLSIKTIESHREHLKHKLGQPSGAALNRSAILWMKTGRLS